MSDAIAVHHDVFGRATLYELDKPYVVHAHREGHLFFYVGGGNGVASVCDDVFRLDSECAAAVSPWQPHNLSFEGGDPSLVLVMYIKPIWFLENSQTVRFSLQFGNPRIAMTDPVRSLVGRVVSYLLDEQSPGLIDGLLFELTRECYRQSWQNRISEMDLSAVLSRFNDFRIRRSLRLIQEHMCEEFGMEDLAREVGLSRPHFFKLFKKQMGITPHIYLNTLRSEKALEELTSTKKSVTEIGLDLGFSSQASFTRFFASNVGIPPSDYRRAASLLEPLANN